jgi:hypothetical protein
MIFSSLHHLVLMSSAGQVEMQAPQWMTIIENSYKAWIKMERKIFQSSWIACGYRDWSEMTTGDTNEPPVTLEDARQLLDVWGNLGQGTPQRCTCYEWQLQDTKF